MQGLHLTADLYHCRCHVDLLTEAATLDRLCGAAVDRCGLTTVDRKFHAFPDYHGERGGVTGALLLAESHLTVHTWPERMGVTLDVYVCNFRSDNTQRAEQLMAELIAAFEPAQRNVNRIQRGTPDVDEDAQGELLLEWLNPYSAYGFRARERLETLRSPYQTIEVFDTPQFGKLFRLDGHYMTSERDEFFYHEPLVHCAALAHPQPRSALVFGGGDGGSTEELFKHRTIERVVMAELDEKVIDVARRHLQSVHRGALDDERLQIVIGDGGAFARTCTERFDLIVLDLTDPDTPASALYRREFFEDARRCLNPGGALTLHIGSPLYTPERLTEILAHLRAVFPIVRPFGLHIPLYGSYWGMAVASESLDPLAIAAEDLNRRLVDRRIGTLDYYTGPVHHALFTLPAFYQRLVSRDDRAA